MTWAQLSRVFTAMGYNSKKHRPLEGTELCECKRPRPFGWSIRTFMAECVDCHRVVTPELMEERRRENG